MNNEPASASKVTPPYLSPVTFFNFVEAHRRTLPDRIDRSLMTNLSGTDQPRILAALRFFGLINEEGYTQTSFQKLRDLDEDGLKDEWVALLRSSYPYLFEGFKLDQATQGQIEERFREQGIKGDTVRKGVAFFVSMARTAGVELSSYIKATRLRATSGAKERKPRTPRGNNNGKNPLSTRPTPSGDLGTLAAVGVCRTVSWHGFTFVVIPLPSQRPTAITSSRLRIRLQSDAESPAIKEKRPKDSEAPES